MIAFDTNVLVRYLTRDDAEQTAAVDEVVTTAVESETPILLGAIVLCETVWVLSGAYGHAREAIADVIEKLLLTRQFEVEAREEVWRALGRYAYGRGDFADYLLGAMHEAEGASVTLTFDGALSNERDFQLLRPRSPRPRPR